jgi:predicted DNA binding CopG/RHH family protein
MNDHTCDPANPDCAAYLHYQNPANRQPAGNAHARAVQPRRLSRHVPIRFEAETIERAKELAEQEGLTVSSWIRRAVEQALQRPPGTYNSAHGNIIVWRAS